MKTNSTVKIRANKDRFLGVLVDDALFERVRRAAQADQRSVSDFLRLLIERELAKKQA